ncbi:MAG: SDR family oxidoreductase [Polyangiales bacterium]
MRVFVTGATGFVGSAIVKELIQAGHHVLGLARSDASAKSLAAAGAEVHRGSLEDLTSLQRGAAEADGVIHTAFIHDFSDVVAAAARDRQAIDALGDALAGSQRPFVVTSALGLVPQGRLVSEADGPDPRSAGAHRIASEAAALALAQRGVRANVIRLPPSVHGPGDYGFVPTLIRIARDKGESVYLGTGEHRWPAVHKLDAARLYRLALEQGRAGAVFHGVAETGVPTREIAEVIGRGLQLPVVAKPFEQAAAHFTWLGRFFALDLHVESVRTQRELDWHPTQIGLIADLAEGHYFTQR